MARNVAKHKTTRREFLAQSGLAAGTAFAAPYFLTSGALAAPGRPGANDRIRMGHIGVNWMGGDHIKMMNNDPRSPSVAVCDVDERHIAKALEYIRPKPKTYRDFRDLLDSNDVDAVLIAVPDHWHALICVYACQAGKDVYCEKPLSLTVREGRAMVDAARRYARVVQTGSQQRAENNFRYACELVRSGCIGKVNTVRVNVWGTSNDCDLPTEPTPPELDWNMWLGPAPKRGFNGKIHPVNWRGFREYSGGTMTDWGAHHLDIARWGLGLDHTHPVEIHPPCKDHKGLRYVFANGVTVLCGHVDANGIRFMGTDGQVEVNRGHLQTWPDAVGKTPLGPSDVHLRRPVAGGAQAWRGNQLDFLASVKSRQRPLCDVEIGYKTIAMCHLGNIALWLNRSLKFDPETETFVGDPEANRWLSRPMRAPWHL